MVDLFFGLSNYISGGFFIFFWFGHFFRRFNIHHLIPQPYSFTFFAPPFFFFGFELLQDWTIFFLGGFYASCME